MTCISNYNIIIVSNCFLLGCYWRLALISWIWEEHHDFTSFLLFGNSWRSCILDTFKELFFNHAWKKKPELFVSFSFLGFMEVSRVVDENFFGLKSRSILTVHVFSLVGLFMLCCAPVFVWNKPVQFLVNGQSTWLWWISGWALYLQGRNLDFSSALCWILCLTFKLEPVSDVCFMCSQFLFDPCKWPRMQMDEDFLKISKIFNAWKSIVRVPDQDPKYKIAILASKQAYLSISCHQLFCFTNYMDIWD